MALSRAVHAQLEEIATLKPGEIHAWGMVRIGHDDAVRLMEGEEIHCVLEALVSRGLDAAVVKVLLSPEIYAVIQSMVARGLSPAVIRTLLTSSGVETVQIAKEIKL